MNLSEDLLALVPNWTTNDTTEGPLDLDSLLGPRRRSPAVAITLTIIYILIFLSGVVGNLCTCLVIARNNYMHTATNYYLFSLAISDLLSLITGVPFEIYHTFEAYPWIFGEPFCIFRTLSAETSSNASILTILAFTIERYIAICHPMKAHKMSKLSRVVRIIIAIWIISCLCALPYPIHIRVFYYKRYADGSPVLESKLCTIPEKWQDRSALLLQVSTFLFFFFPMTIITILYILIGITLWRSGMKEEKKGQSKTHRRLFWSRGDNSSHVNVHAQSRRAVLKMLVAVVVAFFVCWAPFHTQRLIAMYVKPDHWTPDLLAVQTHLYFISGVLYFVSSIINPLLYNIMSKRYREAFRDTLCCREKNAHRIQSVTRCGQSVRTYSTYMNGNNGSTMRSRRSIDGANSMPLPLISASIRTDSDGARRRLQDSELSEDSWGRRRTFSDSSCDDVSRTDVDFSPNEIHLLIHQPIREENSDEISRERSGVDLS